MTMTPRQSVITALRGGHSAKVPFTMYENKIPQCAAERELRNRGLCIVNRNVPVFRTHTPNVRTSQTVYWEDGRQFIRQHYETPAGNLTTLKEMAGFTHWTHEKLFKTPDDYKAILFMIQDEQYEPCYESFAAAERASGEDMILRAGIGLEPLQSLVSGEYLDTATFCMEWMDSRDEILILYNALVVNRRKIYPLVAASPATHANYGGNVTPEIVGLELFDQYYVPHYNEAAEALHQHGKWLGCHFDANCKLLSKSIAATALDYVEAFTPSPDTDMTLAEARAAWPNKVLWLNYPSSVHLRPDAEVEQIAFDLLDQAGTPDGLIMGITEDIPPDRWQNSCRAIMDGLDRHASAKPALYA